MVLAILLANVPAKVVLQAETVLQGKHNLSRQQILKKVDLFFHFPCLKIWGLLSVLGIHNRQHDQPELYLHKESGIPKCLDHNKLPFIYSQQMLLRWFVSIHSWQKTHC